MPKAASSVGEDTTFVAATPSSVTAMASSTSCRIWRCSLISAATSLAIVNRSDLGDDHTQQYLESQDIGVVAEIPFRPDVAEAYANGKIAAAASPELRNLLLPMERHLFEEAAP